MSRILISSGPTRQYLDPVRYLTNASSGRMGVALASAAIDAGHDVIVLSGPVSVEYPQSATVIDVVTTDDLLDAANEHFPRCDGFIGAAAPCDYRPRRVSTSKIAKDGQPIEVELIETPDVVAELGRRKRDDQWVVGFALETEDQRFRATVKLQKKHCNLIVSNGPSAIDSDENSIEIIAPGGKVLSAAEGTKIELAAMIMRRIDEHLIRPRLPAGEATS